MNVSSSSKGSLHSPRRVFNGRKNKSPDYFVGIRIVAEQLNEIHKHVVLMTPQIEGMMLDPCESHVTLGILKVKGVGNPDTSLQQAVQGFVKGALKARHTVGKRPIKFHDFSTFRNSVLYLKPTEECAAYLSEIRQCIFQQNDISEFWIDDDTNRQYAPHLTIAKHSRFKGKKADKMKLDPYDYADISKDLCPVLCMACSVQLCRIAGRKKGEYYTVIAEEML